MKNDDYYVVVYKILSLLYEKIKLGEWARLHEYIGSGLAPEDYGIREDYFIFIIAALAERDFIGVDCSMTVDEFLSRLEMYFEGEDDSPSIKITAKGIEYLFENKMMNEVRDYMAYFEGE